jgi:hypothetical protein
MNTKFYLRNLKERDHLGDLIIARKIILKWILQKYSIMIWSEFIWLRIGIVRGSLL